MNTTHALDATIRRFIVRRLFAPSAAAPISKYIILIPGGALIGLFIASYVPRITVTGAPRSKSSTIVKTKDVNSV